jgi:hypothetical protein
MAYEIVMEHAEERVGQKAYAEHGIGKKFNSILSAKQCYTIFLPHPFSFTWLWLICTDFCFDLVSFCLQDINNVP